MEDTDDTAVDPEAEEAGRAEVGSTRSLTELEHDNNLDLKRDSTLHDAFRQGPSASTLQLRLIREQPRLLSQQDDSWEGWLPLHNAARWGTLRSVAEAAVAACAAAAKTCSKGGYEPLHLAAMGGHLGVCEAIVAAYPEGVLKRDNNGRTPLEEAREGGHEEILLLFRALPGVLEAEEAEAECRARSTRSEFLLEPPGCEASSDEEDVEEAPARSLASRMFHASLGALWRSSGADQTREAATRVQLASFFAERARSSGRLEVLLLLWRAAARHACASRGWHAWLWVALLTLEERPCRRSVPDERSRHGQPPRPKLPILSSEFADVILSQRICRCNGVTHPRKKESALHTPGWIPLRLVPSERRVLRLLEGVLHVSQYTDRIDAHGLHEAPAKRRQVQLLRELRPRVLLEAADLRRRGCSPV